MPITAFAPPTKIRFFTSTGSTPLSGGKVYFYEPDGSYSTLKNTYSDYEGATANANPVILDANGEANIRLLGLYDVKVTDASDITQHTVRNYQGAVETLEFDGVSALRAATVINGQTYWLRYHTTEGDGGGGRFRGVTGAVAGTYTHDNGITFVPVGGDGSSAIIREDVDDLTVEDFGIQGDGVNDYTSVFQSMTTALKNTGLVVKVPEGNYILTGGFSIEGFSLVGTGLYDWENVTGYGSVFSISGALETTASNMFTVVDGELSGIVFYHPNQVANVTTPTITPAGYVISIYDSTTQRGGVVNNNVFVNCYNCIENKNGWSVIKNNKLCPINIGIRDTVSMTEHPIRGNILTYGIWYASIGQDIRSYISQNSTGIYASDSAASFSENTLFGLYYGYRFLGDILFVEINGGIIDGCTFDVSIDSTSTGGTLRLNGVHNASTTPGSPGSSTSELVTIKGSCIKVSNPAGNVLIISDGCKYDGANGHVIDVSNATGAGRVDLVVSGGSINNPGRFAHTYIIDVSSASGTFANGDTVTGATSGATAVVRKWDATASQLYVDDVNGTFTASETLNASPSGASATYTSIANNATYNTIWFNDANGGRLIVDGVASEWQNYEHCAGIRVVDGGEVTLLGNSFKSALTTAGKCIQVDSCVSLIESGNISNMSGADTDIQIGTVTNPPVVGPSVWSRQPIVQQDKRAWFHTTLSAIQTISTTTETTLQFDTETYDRSANFNTTSYTFTAPETGIYHLEASVPHDNTATAGDLWRLRIRTSNRDYFTDFAVSAQIESVNVSASSVDMESGDTAYVTIQRIAGTGVFVSRTLGAWFAGHKHK